MTESRVFRLGVNYWPAKSAMGFWRHWDARDLRRDLTAIRSGGFDSVRIFLTWEDFQPSPNVVDKAMLRQLVETLDIASSAGLSIMPTLFTGHMSGANWLPGWAVQRESGRQRFRVVCGGKEVLARPIDWYANDAVREGQVRLASECAAALEGHPALQAWDLGNENSNCVVPKSREAARSWLGSVSDAIRNADSKTPITLGLHMEDLEEDRRLTPRDAAQVCDFLTMHGYPGYASFTDGPTDERLLPFLAQLTRFLGGDKEVLFSEFGVPTHTRPKRSDRSGTNEASDRPALVSEKEAASYVQRALRALFDAGASGAMLWCYSDYEPQLHDSIPFDGAPHEISFGMFRSDGTVKPAVEVVRSFASEDRWVAAVPLLSAESFIDLSHDDFYDDPKRHLVRLYGRYCKQLEQAGHISE